MGTLGNTYHPRKDNIRKYIIALVNIAKADNEIKKEELELIQKIASDNGFTKEEVDVIIKAKGETDYFPPMGKEDRFTQLYEMVSIMLHDGILDEREMKMCRMYAISGNHDPDFIDSLIKFIIAKVNLGLSPDEAYDVYLGEIK